MKNQRLVAAAFFAAFFLIGGYLLMSAQGIFLNWKTFRFVKTGGAFFNFSPRSAQLAINGEIYETSFFFPGSGELVKKLKPGQYSLSLSEEKFRPWEKKFEIKPGLVAEFKKISLIREEISRETLTAAAVKNFWLTAKGIVYQDSRNQLYFEEFRLPGEMVAAADRHSSLLVLAAGQELFITDLNNPKTVINLSRLFNSLKQRQLGLPGQVAIKKIFFHPLTRNKIIAASQKAVYEIDLKKVEISMFEGINPENIAAISEIGIIFRKNDEVWGVFDLALKKESAENISLPIPEKIAVNPKGETIGLIDAAGAFYFYDPEKISGFQPIADEKFSDLSFSPDNLYLALVSQDKRLTIVNFKEKTTSTIMLETRPAAEISWLENVSHYLVIQENESLIIQDVFGQPPFNRYLIAEDVARHETAGRTIYALTASQTLIKFEL